MAITILAQLASSSVKADVRVNRQSDVVRIDATNATVAEILSTLGADHDVHYRASVALSRTVSGTYIGTLQRVVSRLLVGYNFVLTVSGERIEAIIVGMPDSAPTGAMHTNAAQAATKSNATSVPASQGPTPAPAPTANDANYNILPGMPSPSQPKRLVLSSMLFSAAQAQMIDATQSRSSSTAASSVSAPTTPQSSDIAEITQRASAQLSTLVAAIRLSAPIGNPTRAASAP